MPIGPAHERSLDQRMSDYAKSLLRFFSFNPMNRFSIKETFTLHVHRGVANINLHTLSEWVKFRVKKEKTFSSFIKKACLHNI